MKKLIILFVIISLQTNAQDLKEFFKFGTVYGAVNGGTSLSDDDVYSVTNGLQTSIVETPYDYSILFGVRKIKKFITNNYNEDKFNGYTYRFPIDLGLMIIQYFSV